MKVLVTGGAGFIASHITDAVIQKGHEAVVVDNLATGKKENINSRARFYNVNIRNLQELEKIFAKEKPDIVNHHAAQTDIRKSMENPSFDAEVNILGSLNVIQLASKYKARKMIFASTSAVYPEPQYLPVDERHPVKPISAYGVAKYAVEFYLHLFRETTGLRFTAFRYGNVYGPRQDPHGEVGVVAIFIERMISGLQPTIFGDGKKTRDYVFVDDVATVNLLAMEDAGDGEVFNIGWENETSVSEVFNAVRKGLGVDVTPKYDKEKPGELNRVCLATKKAKDLFGWTPKIKFEEGIGLTINSFKQAKAHQF